jgi:hypothetical protein
MKRILFLAFMLLSVQLAFSQSITGGAGVCVVDTDPDNITAMQDQDERYECVVAWDNTNQVLYLYDAGQLSGSRWTPVPLADVNDTDTRLNNPRVVGADLVFDLYDEKSDTDIGDVSVPIANIAPVQSIDSGTGISVSDVGGTFTITNTQPDQTVGITSGAGINVTGTYPNFTITNTATAGNTTDEIQDLSISGNSLSLTQDPTPSPIDLSIYLDNTDTQDLSIVGNTLSLTDGGSVPIDGNPENEAQSIALAVATGIATIDLTDVGVVDGGAVTISQGDGITVTSGGANDAQITNTEFAAVAAAYHADAGVQGVAIGEYFYTTAANTMGLPAGTKVRRAF